VGLANSSALFLSNDVDKNPACFTYFLPLSFFAFEESFVENN
jgi:hypothetical protein